MEFSEALKEKLRVVNSNPLSKLHAESRPSVGFTTWHAKASGHRFACDSNTILSAADKSANKYPYDVVATGIP
jgi:hypothetical protein